MIAIFLLIIFICLIIISFKFGYQNGYTHGRNDGVFETEYKYTYNKKDPLDENLTELI